MLERLSWVGAVVAACVRPVAVVAALTVASCPILGPGSASAMVNVRAVVGVQGQIESISCTSARNCAAVGHSTAMSRYRLFAVTEKKGVWGRATVVPGLGSDLLLAEFTALSCSSAGNCGAGGIYASGNLLSGFVVSEKNGVWGKAEQVPGLAALNKGDDASVGPVVCPSAGNCVAGGFYSSVADASQDAFVVSEKNGVWGKAEEVPGLAALNTGGGASLGLIACASAGKCLGIGRYADTSGSGGYFAVTERNGTWGQAQPIRGAAAAELTGVSCSSAGNCTAIGDHPETAAAFVIHQSNGVWGAPIPVRGLGSLPGGGAIYTTFNSLSCPLPGNCTAVGFYFDQAGGVQPFVVTEKSGIWGRARVLPGVARLNTGQFAESPVVACRSAGNCTAAGSYDGSKQPNTIPGDFQVFVSTEKDGVWGRAIELPGLAALNRGKSTSDPVLSCGAPGNCTVGGGYHGAGGFKPFLAIQRHGIWGKAHEVNGFR